MLALWSPCAQGRVDEVSGAAVGKRVVTVVCAVLCGIVGTVLVLTAVTGSRTPPRAPEPDRAQPDTAVQVQRELEKPRDTRSDAPRKHGVRDLITGPTLPESRPVRLELPRIGVSTPLVELRLDAAGAMEVPQDPGVAGWYALGPTPGALGPAVIAGHVSWNRVPAVFFRLGALRPGDRVHVTRRDHTRAVFAVTRVARFEKSRFPTRAVFGNIDHAGLRLITCGGRYDGARHRYLDNVVVFARLVRR